MGAALNEYTPAQYQLGLMAEKGNHPKYEDAIFCTKKRPRMVIQSPKKH